MNKDSRRSVIEQYRNRKGSLDWNPLMNYVSAILNARDVIEEKASQIPFNKEKAQEAIEKSFPYLLMNPASIDPKEFKEGCKFLFRKFVEDGVVSPDHVEELGNINFDDLSDATIELAGKDPEKFFISASSDLLKDNSSEIAPVFLAGILSYVLRGFLNQIGEQMSSILAKQDEVVKRSRPTHCPTCGQAASLSTVLEGSDSQGSARRLFCCCCGTVWPYERVRCGFCGTTNTNKLDYYYAEEDPGHRLHVCGKCGGALPTVFQEALGIPVDFDVEMAASSVVQSLWANQQVEKGSQSETETKNKE